MGKTTPLWVLVQLRLIAALGDVGVCRRERGERGDVPGWVLVTVMSVAIVMGIWTLADEQLNQMLRAAFAKVR